VVSGPEKKMSLAALVEISSFYGKNPDYVLAGGGNTSWKEGDTLYIKASGTSLAAAVPDAFVKMDRKALARIWENQYPGSSAERESAVLADLMAAKKPGEEKKRPSVETLLHDILPFAFVVHLHPALVNGLTCSQEGEKAAEEIFGKEALWIPSINPGFILSKTVKSMMNDYIARNNIPAPIILLQNHGIFVGDNHCEGIKEKYGELMHKISAWIKRYPDFSDEKRESSDSLIGESVKMLTELAGAAVFMQSKEVSALVKNRSSFAPVSSAFTPDHIVYAGSESLFSEAKTAASLREDWEKYKIEKGNSPKIIALQGLGVIAAAATEKAAQTALDIFRDAIKIAVYSESFGGPKYMSAGQIDFISNWEVEHYRASVSVK
jgi:rhamnose utilization protein RhaD (predicted bifunctional aldolase and dehydrogenase)